VILPDRRLLAIGGTNSSSEDPTLAQFHADAELFDPGLPLTLGSWKEVAGRPQFSAGMDPAPRAYHHVALLLQDGRVAVMGGKRPAGNLTRPDGSVEVYKPAYSFESGRPRITSTAVQDIHYGAPFCISVEDPARVTYAVLIGISSVTHHFDYGQRYVELMTTLNVSGCTGNVKILAPPLKGMAPEGYYLLFVVEIRGNTRIPSKGVFVRLF
jgi:galactose oxidase